MALAALSRRKTQRLYFFGILVGWLLRYVYTDSLRSIIVFPFSVISLIDISSLYQRIFILVLHIELKMQL